MKNPTRIFKDRIYEQLARIGKAVASPPRLEILELLSQRPRTVENLAREVRLTVANASRHLQILRSARLIEAEKEGVFVRYALANDEVADFLRSLRLLAASRLADDVREHAVAAALETFDPTTIDALWQGYRLRVQTGADAPATKE